MGYQYNEAGEGTGRKTDEPDVDPVRTLDALDHPKGEA